MKVNFKKALLLTAMSMFLTAGLASAADKQPFDNPPPPQEVQQHHKDLKAQSPAPKPPKEKKHKKVKKVNPHHNQNAPEQPKMPR